MKNVPFKRPRRKPYYRRSGRSTHKRSIARIKPSADARLKKVFARIGVPSQKDFKPDNFQLEAVSIIADSDCLVSAPTGSGKTWIAQEAIRRVHSKGKRAWYASPLKALTNSKLSEFGQEFGHEHVGILTGDRKENPDAPIIVGTTEILRNQLYDAMYEGKDLKTDLVILDEAHFLGDEDRGVVWEEIMIYLPQRIHLLLLSATVGNARQVAGWLESIRFKRCVVVEETGRPVPLFPLFFHPSGRLFPLLGANGIDKKVRDYLNSSHPQILAAPGQLPPFGDIMKVLKKYDLLPAIFFMKSRADCDAALDRCIADLSPGKQDKLKGAIDGLIEGHARLADHRQMWPLQNMAVAAHHSGQLPAWKLLIEGLMTKGSLDAVFATSTVAAGVNFPARSVVFLNSDRYNGHKFVPLGGTEFHQTTGRAGRRGKDRIGFAVVIPGKYMDIGLIARLCASPSEAVLSKIRLDFSMVLNLLLSHRPVEIKEIFRKSFATYLDVINRQPKLDQKFKAAGSRLMELLPESLCGGPDVVLDLIRKRRALIWESKDLKRRFKRLKSRLSKTANLVPGRLFLDRRGRMYCVCKSQIKGGEKGVLALRVKEKPSFHGKHLRMRWFPAQKVSQILDEVLKLPDAKDTRETKELIVLAASRGSANVLTSLPLSQGELAQLNPISERLFSLQEQLDELTCNNCRYLKTCHGKTKGPFRSALDDFALLWDRMNAVRMELWKDFVRHLEFLKEEGFIDESDKLTHDGLWASQLRLDQPLMVAEALRLNVLPDSNPVLLAALVAPFVHDRDVEDSVNESNLTRALLKAYENMKKNLIPLMKRKEAWGFEVKPITLWASASIYAWASGQSWENVLEMAGISEGDLAMLVLRTAENLRQIGSLRKTYPAISQIAFEAIDIILREPVATKC